MTAAQVVEALRAQGERVDLVGRCAGGEVGAYEVRRPDGTRLVLKWRMPTDESDLLGLRTALEALRARGYPVPGYLLVTEVAGHEVCLQRHLPGAWRDDLSAPVVRHLTELNRLQAGGGPPSGATWGDFLLGVTLGGGRGWCRHESLEAHSGRTAAAWRRIRGIAEAWSGRRLPDGDLVHLDFHHRNVLQVEGRVGGVVDWEGARSGDRTFDLVTLAFCSSAAGYDVETRSAWLRQLAGDAEPGLVRLYTAHLALRQIDWSIRNRTPDDVEHWLARSAEALDALDPSA